MDLFGLKLKLSNTILADQILNPKTITNTDQRISNLIGGFEYDYQKVKQSRIKNRNEIISLQKALERVNELDFNTMKSIERTSVKDIRSYEKQLRKQIYDIVKIINSLKKLIEDEDLELMYDIRQPLTIFEEFINRLKVVMKGIQLDKTTAGKIQMILLGIEKEYESLIGRTIQFIENDFKYFKSIGLEFDKINPNLETDYALVTHLKNRAKSKQQINGKVQWIISQIQQLEKRFISLKDNKKIDQNVAFEVIRGLSYFETQFKELIQVCISRVDIANHMIIESAVMQKDKYRELEMIKQELKDFYKQFIVEQERIKENEKNKIKVQQASKRIEEFDEYKKELELLIRSFEKEFELKVEKVEKKEIKELKIEEKQLHQDVKRIGMFSSRFKKAVATAVLVTSVFAGAGFAQKGYSTYGYLLKEDTASVESLKSNPDLASKIIINKDTGDISYMDFKSSEVVCAGYVKMAYEKMYGSSSAQKNGVYGNAWHMPANILAKGGKVIWKGTGDLDYSLLKKGDIIGVRYRMSKYLPLAQKAGQDFTHVVLVVGFDGKTPLIAHLFHSPLLNSDKGDRIDNLSKNFILEPRIVLRTHANL
ncbi:hypothetical protein J4403_01155 [Candidatus Woesearchaeota archaeon]|nr:hypothetical protein [Candidatus Woesearchaeota archaeon]